MYRIIVETTSNVTANLNGDKIVEDDGFFKVYNDGELVGAFDVGSTSFIYKSKAKTNVKE